MIPAWSFGDRVRKARNQYKGIATVRTARRLDEHKVGLTVTYDGDSGVWETDRGAFLFVIDQPGGASR